MAKQKMIRQENAEIRAEIMKRGLKHYEVANRLGLDVSWFSHWLQMPLTEERKNRILKVLQEYDDEQKKMLQALKMIDQQEKANGRG